MLLSVQTGDVVDDLGFEAGYRLLRDCGFEAIDWNIDHAWDQGKIRRGELSGCVFEKSPEDVLAYYADELAEIRKNGLVITQAHAPFPAYVKGVPGLETYAAEMYRGCIRLCQAVGCKNLIVHGISRNYNEPERTAQEIWEKNLALYTALLPALEGTDVTVCLENLFVGGTPVTEGVCSDPHEAVEMIDTLNQRAGRECFGLCLDTGHLNLLHRNIYTYVSLLGKRIKALHIHDNDGVSDQHLMPFVGTFRWNDFLQALKDVGYEGDLSFETFAQVRSNRMDPEFIPPFLRAIAGVGQVFRSRLQGE